MTRKFGVLAAIAALIMALMAGPAYAGKTSDHDGDAGDSSEVFTEGTDSDAVANCDDTTVSSHPSGNDRFCEKGGSVNQGKSESDPDDNLRGPERTNGGFDKPEGLGGVDIFDQDGNNGCGNDQDFEDDNEGWCGKPSLAGTTDSPTTVLGNTETKVNEPKVQVLGEKIEKPLVQVLGAGAVRDPKPVAVLGVKMVNGQPLPRTGLLSWQSMLTLALSMLAVGLLIESTNKRVAHIG